MSKIKSTPQLRFERVVWLSMVTESSQYVDQLNALGQAYGVIGIEGCVYEGKIDLTYDYYLTPRQSLIVKEYLNKVNIHDLAGIINLGIKGTITSFYLRCQIGPAEELSARDRMNAHRELYQILTELDIDSAVCQVEKPSELIL